MTVDTRIRKPAPNWIPGPTDHDRVPTRVTWWRGVGEHDFEEYDGEVFPSYMEALASVVATYGESATRRALNSEQGGGIFWLKDDLGFSLDVSAAL